MRNIYKCASLICSLMLFSACTKDLAVDPDSLGGCSEDYTYDGEIKAIIDLNCSLANCHDATGGSSGIPMSNYSEVQSIAIQPSFLGSIKHQGGYEAMPINGSGTQLDAATIDSLECWIIDGTPEN